MGIDMELLEGIVIITTLEEPGMPDYRQLLPTIKSNAPQKSPLHIVALTGDISDLTLSFLDGNVDHVTSFKELPSYESFQPLAKVLAHPLGKVAKLFFALDFVEAHVADNASVLFLDPDTHVQAPLDEFTQIADTPSLFLGHELQHIHFAHIPNPRLVLAERFDSSTTWRGSYFMEVNTGVVLGQAHIFKKVVRDFLEFVLESPYTKQVAPQLSQHHWHDQDYFRYFLRKTLREDIAILDLGHIYTTNRAAAACIYYDETSCLYRTIWGIPPSIVHFAEGTREYAAASQLTWDPTYRKFQIPSPEDPMPPLRNPIRRPSMLMRLLSKSPLDWMRFFRNRISRTFSR